MGSGAARFVGAKTPKLAFDAGSFAVSRLNW